MLAIAAPAFNAPSESFIRNHVRTTAPTKTVLLCFEGSGAHAYGYPVLSDLDPWVRPTGFRDRLVNAVRFRWRKYFDPAIRGANCERIVGFLSAHKAQAVLAEYGPVGCLLMAACQNARVPLYVHFHGYDASKLIRDNHRVRHYHKLFRIAAGIIAPSRFLAEKLAAIGCPAEKLHVVPCGVDADRFRPTSRQAESVVAVGRLVDKKAPHLTIEAFAHVANRFPTMRLDMVGDGPLRESCIALVTKLGLGDRVVLHGALDHQAVAALMQNGVLFVQHSVTAENGDTEGMPVAILEAMASALPVVSTIHGGIPEAVECGTTGLLVSEHDVSGMASAMAEVLIDPIRAEAMGAAGRARVLDRFAIQHTRDRLRTIMGL